MLCSGNSESIDKSRSRDLLSQEHFKPLKKFNSIKKTWARGISFSLFLLPESFDQTLRVGLNIIEAIKVISHRKTKSIQKWC